MGSCAANGSVEDGCVCVCLPPCSAFAHVRVRVCMLDVFSASVTATSNGVRFRFRSVARTGRVSLSESHGCCVKFAVSHVPRDRELTVQLVIWS